MTLVSPQCSPSTRAPWCSAPVSAPVRPQTPTASGALGSSIAVSRTSAIPRVQPDLESGCWPHWALLCWSEPFPEAPINAPRPHLSQAVFGLHPQMSSQMKVHSGGGRKHISPSASPQTLWCLWPPITPGSISKGHRERVNWGQSWPVSVRLSHYDPQTG